MSRLRMRTILVNHFSLSPVDITRDVLYMSSVYHALFYYGTGFIVVNLDSASSESQGQKKQNYKSLHLITSHMLDEKI